MNKKKINFLWRRVHMCHSKGILKYKRTIQSDTVYRTSTSGFDVLSTTVRITPTRHVISTNLILKLSYVLMFSLFCRTNSRLTNSSNCILFDLGPGIGIRKHKQTVSVYFKISLKCRHQFTELHFLFSLVLTASTRNILISTIYCLLQSAGNLRSGIVGIERKLQEKVENNASNISAAFQDMKNLIDMAKEMVHLAGVMSTKIKDRCGDISEDDTIKFKSYLISLGIADPVTKSACTSNEKFWKQLAKEISTLLLSPVSEAGGLMSLSDAYCRVNRARGFELLSAEDFFKACNIMADENLPIVLQKFESGVYVLQLQSKTNVELQKEIEKLLQANQKLSALQVSQELRIPIMLARERLLTMERVGLTCRDDTVTGLIFYPNLFAA
nr:EOG090X09MN [Megafenestra aurita]